MAKETVAKGELVAGIVGTIDIGSLVTEGFVLADDITRATAKLNEIKAVTQSYFNTANTKAVSMAQGDGSAIVSNAKVILFQDVNNLSMLARDQAIQSAGGYKISSLALGQWAKLYSVFQHVDLNAKALIDIPEAMALEKVQHYYNKLLAPHTPSDTDLMIMAKEGTITYQEVVTKYQEESGFDSNHAFWLASIKAQQVGKPDLQTYWTMVRKGLTLESEWYLAAQRGHGYSRADAEALYKQFYRKPSEADMMVMAKSGIGSYGECITAYQDAGFNLDNASKLLQVRSNQIGKPDLRTYWTMVRKGLISENDWYSLAQKGHGYSKADADALYKEFFYTLSPMELFRISDLMPTSATWIDTRLRALGFSDTDRTLIANLIQNRTTKDEVTQTWNIIADNYAWGLQTEDDLTAFLTENHVPDIQAKAKLIIANLLRAKVVMKLMRDSEIYLYRKDVQNENQLLTALQSLNISTDVANAITRNEASKKGLDWEIPE